MPAKSFISTYTVTLDSKGRVCVPAPYRQLLAAMHTDGVYVCPSNRGEMLECFGDDVLDREKAKLDGLDPFSKEYDRRAARMAIRTHCLPFDENGRIRLPDALIAHAHLADKAAIVGAFGKFQIWEPSRFEAFLAEALEEEPAPATGGGSV
jgi:MraZ protein